MNLAKKLGWAWSVAPKKLGNGSPSCSWRNWDTAAKMHVYEIRPRKDHRGVTLIPLRCHSFASGTVNQTQSAMQSATLNIAADHTMP
jgi:hypothetical protein